MNRSALSKKVGGATRKRGASRSKIGGSTARAITKIEGRVYTHRIIWRVVVDAAKRAASRHRDANARVTACVFAAFTVEAYLNLLIEHIDGDVYAKERVFFGKGRYSGIRGKLRWVEKQLAVSAVGTIARDRAAVLEILRLRDQLAHAKPIPYAREIEHAIAVDPPWLEDRWIEKATTPARVKACISAVESYIEWLHGHASGRFKDPHLKRDALKGVLQSQTTTTSAKV